MPTLNIDPKFATILIKLQKKASQLPTVPGVYLFKNESAAIIYVGKAKNLKNRVRSYFTNIENHNHKTRALVEKIVDFEFLQTKNEYESLILENNYIKHHKPHYNILLRDDKTYPYIRVDIQEKWPRVTTTRRRKEDGALYFGPYTMPHQLHAILHIISRYFPLVKCTPYQFKTAKRPCHYYEIQKCWGPCCLPVEEKEYKALIDKVVLFLQGRTTQVLKLLKNDMETASQRENYEAAAQARDCIHAIENTQDLQAISLYADIDLDLLFFLEENDLALFAIFKVRQGHWVASDFVFLDHFFKNDILDQSEFKEELSTQFLIQYYEKKELPTQLWVENFSVTTAVQDFLKKKKSLEKLNIETGVTPQFLKGTQKNQGQVAKKQFALLCETARQNAKNRLNEKISLDEISLKKLHAVQSLLDLKMIPKRIECMDISTMQGYQTVGSLVVFEDAAPNKKQYRKFIIRDLEAGEMDDFRALQEVILRRFKNRDIMCDLLVLDGGTPQLRAALEVLKEIGLEDLPVVGLAKSRTKRNFKASEVTASQERLVIPGTDRQSQDYDTVVLDPHSLEFQVLTQLRDEAHRFAVTFHRSKREKLDK